MVRRWAIAATYGWYRAVDAHAVQAAGFGMHLVHLSAITSLRKRQRVKTDAKDSFELANLLRLVLLPDAWTRRRLLGRSVS